MDSAGLGTESESSCSSFRANSDSRTSHSGPIPIPEKNWTRVRNWVRVRTLVLQPWKYAFENSPFDTTAIWIYTAWANLTPSESRQQEIWPWEANYPSYFLLLYSWRIWLRNTRGYVSKKWLLDVIWVPLTSKTRQSDLRADSQVGKFPRLLTLSLKTLNWSCHLTVFLTFVTHTQVNIYVRNVQ